MSIFGFSPEQQYLRDCFEQKRRLEHLTREYNDLVVHATNLLNSNAAGLARLLQYIESYHEVLPRQDQVVQEAYQRYRKVAEEMQQQLANYQRQKHQQAFNHQEPQQDTTNQEKQPTKYQGLQQPVVQQGPKQVISYQPQKQSNSPSKTAPSPIPNKEEKPEVSAEEMQQQLANHQRQKHQQPFNHQEPQQDTTNQEKQPTNCQGLLQPVVQQGPKQVINYQTQKQSNSPSKIAPSPIPNNEEKPEASNVPPVNTYEPPVLGTRVRPSRVTLYQGGGVISQVVPTPEVMVDTTPPTAPNPGLSCQLEDDPRPVRHWCLPIQSGMAVSQLLTMDLEQITNQDSPSKQIESQSQLPNENNESLLTVTENATSEYREELAIPDENSEAPSRETDTKA
ncbi:hypothetical protein SY88_13465 [Clostridiales bacterium PH28_bin88]|nr:hypothetical protein SY88_13465 [Clostridiales bacterium PH28_bin88]